MTTTSLASALRAWRERIPPEAVGIEPGRRRRAAGLRREELAERAGVSVDYVVRLEQGRATNPSPEVVAALARALLLSGAERDLLHRTVGLVPPASGPVPSTLGPGVVRILDRLDDCPVAVHSAAWQLVHANRLWLALFGDDKLATGRDGNLVWRWFTAKDSLLARDDPEFARFGRELVSDLRDTVARYPDDVELEAMVRDLRAANPWFGELWDAHTVERRVSDRKTIDSPRIGPVTVDCDVLTVPGSDLRIVVYTATPGTEDAEKLARLAEIATTVG